MNTRKFRSIQVYPALILVLGITFWGSSAVADTLIDDFSGGSLVNYTSTVILDVNGGASNTSAWTDAGEVLGLETTAFDAIEQTAFTRNGLSLAIGEELKMDLSSPTSGSQDIGLYVGHSNLTAGTRQDYVNIYQRSDGSLFTLAFDGTTFQGTTDIGGALGGATPDTIFIKHSAMNEFEVGYYLGGTRTSGFTYNLTNLNDASNIGIYSDVRSTGTLGFGDNLRIFTAVPEPSSLGLLGLGSLAIFIRRRRV